MKNTENALIDAAINELDIVMTGGVDPGAEVPEFTAECMNEMRAIIRKLISQAVA